ncbi:uncharacterized protein LOC131856305 [Cryptomeria japonica]|uniref:uncharacterized protein LOC131856305 n=1 Tax=Cryptomeria japonica TaxID=3369 RepID=UPI0027DA6981|nr:uncharacterized protein LOC131856305 [Cryptomeria japonica]
MRDVVLRLACSTALEVTVKLLNGTINSDENNISKTDANNMTCHYTVLELPQLRVKHSQKAFKIKAVVITTPGGPDVMQVQEVDDPQLNDEEVLIKICATALNRTDTLQRQGMYPLPNGVPPYPGLESSGVIEAVGKTVDKWKVGDQEL